jgi:hypothetical protein
VTNIRKDKLERLHIEHLKNPPAGKEVLRREKVYLTALKRKAEREAEMSALSEAQKEMGELKADVRRRRQQAADAFDAEMEALAQRSKAAYERMILASQDSDATKNILDGAAEALLLAHGHVPIFLEGIRYTFGCYGERVYLVPQPKQSHARTSTVERAPAASEKASGSGLRARERAPAAPRSKLKTQNSKRKTR